MAESILVVDDEKQIADLIELYLENDGYTIYKYYNGTDALKCIEEVSLDLAILDIMLPDYITMPFNPLEVTARVRTQLRRYMRYNNSAPRREEEVHEYDIRGLVINKEEHKCSLFGQELSLTPTEFSVLWYLCEHQGVVVPSEELFESVWGEKYLNNNNNTVMAHIGRLREKMEEPAKNPKFIKTVWGVGYTIER